MAFAVNKMVDLAFNVNGLGLAYQLLKQQGVSSDQETKIFDILHAIIPSLATEELFQSTSKEELFQSKKRIFAILKANSPPKIANKVAFVFPTGCRKDWPVLASCSGLFKLSYDALLQIFSDLDPYTEMNALLCVCKGMDDLVRDSLIEQLNKKETLRIDDFETYRRRLNTEPWDWSPIFNHCKELKAFSCKSAFRKNNSSEAGKKEEARISIILASAKERCPKLTQLNLSGCSGVGDTTISYLASNFIHLTLLDLEICKYSNDGIKSLFESCKNLTSINLSSNDSINDDVVVCVANNCQKLCELNLANSVVRFSGAITDISICVLAQQCTSLMRLNIPNSDITDASLYVLGENCKNLILFNHLSFLPFCSGGGADALTAMLPKLVFSMTMSGFDLHY
jgi:hypothetical protein